MLRASLITLLAATAFNGCIYANYRSPVSYRSPTPSDVPGPLGPEVEGESCNKLVLWLVAWGDAGYSAAVDAAKAKSGASMLADVQVDNRVYNVLGVYQKSCTRIALQSTRRAQGANGRCTVRRARRLAYSYVLARVPRTVFGPKRGGTAPGTLE